VPGRNHFGISWLVRGLTGGPARPWQCGQLSKGIEAMNKPQPNMHTEPEPVRRKLAADYRKRSTEKRWTDEERATFARMAESWERTLPKKRE